MLMRRVDPMAAPARQNTQECQKKASRLRGGGAARVRSSLPCHRIPLTNMVSSGLLHRPRRVFYLLRVLQRLLRMLRRHYL